MSDLPDKTCAPPWWESGRMATQQELADWLSITSPENREWWLERIQQQASDAARCWEQGHDSLQERLDNAYARLREANARIEWFSKHYGPLRPDGAL